MIEVVVILYFLVIYYLLTSTYSYNVGFNGTVHYSLRDSNVIVQYGESRSGSTFQWYVLCSIMHIIHPDKVKKIDCNGGRKKEINVLKIHFDRSIANIKSDLDLKFKDQLKYYFITSRTINIDLMQFGNNHSLVYYQFFYELEVRKLGLLFEYGDIFELSETEMRILYQHMRYWDIMRQCCGLQQSIYNRMVLHNLQLATVSYLDLDYPACEIYHLKQVENSFINSNFSLNYPAQLKVAYDMRLVSAGFCELMENHIRNGSDFNINNIFKTKSKTFRRKMDSIDFSSKYHFPNTNYSLRDSKVLVQYGDDSLESSFQWYILCSIMRIINRNQKETVNCMSSFAVNESSTVNVIKVVSSRHHVDWIKLQLDNIFRNQQKFYFLSSNKLNLDSFGDNHSLVYTQQSLKLEVHWFAYMHVFQLSETEMRILYQHMRYWDIMRQCCGLQQSIYNRMTWHNLQLTTVSYLDLDYPACEIYNLKQVESNYLSSNLSLLYPKDIMKFIC